MAKTSKKSAAKTENGLNLQQEAFCQLYINADREMFGNGAQCYLSVYGAEYLIKNKRPMRYEVAMASASRELRKVNVIARINSLLETGGFTNENIDKQHLFLINQHADLKTKMAAIKEFNILKKRITNNIDLTSGGKPLFDNETWEKSKRAIAGFLGAGDSRKGK